MASRGLRACRYLRRARVTCAAPTGSPGGSTLRQLAFLTSSCEQLAPADFKAAHILELCRPSSLSSFIFKKQSCRATRDPGSPWQLRNCYYKLRAFLESKDRECVENLVFDKKQT